MCEIYSWRIYGNTVIIDKYTRGFVQRTKQKEIRLERDSKC